ncbi:hypothetical protein TKK_0015277 [Trichogramma kaykai]
MFQCNISELSLRVDNLFSRMGDIREAINAMISNMNIIIDNQEELQRKHTEAERNQAYLIEKVEEIKKATLDLNVQQRLRNEQVNIQPVPPTRDHVPIEQLLSSTIAPIDGERHTLSDTVESAAVTNTSENLRIRSKLDATINDIKSRTRVKRNYRLDSKTIFSDWLEFLKAELEYNDLLQYIESSALDDETLEVKTKINALIKDIIVSRVDKSFQHKIISMRDPVEILKKIKETRAIESNTNSFDLKCDIFEMRMKKGEKVSDFVDRFEKRIKIYNESEPEEPLSDHDKSSAFFRATKEICEEMRRSNWMQKVKSRVGMTVEEMKTYLLQAEADRDANAPTHKARVAQAMQNTCFKCNEPGHMVRDCPNGYFCYLCKAQGDHVAANCPNNKRYVKTQSYYNNSRGRGKGRGEGRGRGGGKVGVGGRNAHRNHPYAKQQQQPNKTQKEKKGECLMTNANSSSKLIEVEDRIEFIADSGATEHITNKGFVLSGFEKCSGEISCANSDKSANISIDGRGTLFLKSVIDDKNIELSNVILATKVSDNLISLRKFVESGYSIYLDDEKLFVFDKLTGKIYLTGSYESPNWILSFDVSKTARDDVKCNLYRAKAKLVDVANFAEQESTVANDPSEPPSTLGRENEQNSVEIRDVEVPIKRKILDLNDVVPQNEIESLSNQEKEIEPVTKFPKGGMLWHIRLGHASLRYLQQLQKREEVLKDIKFGNEILDCETCALAKIEKLPFKNCRDRASRCLHTINTDTMGPISPASFPDNNKFIIVFIDDYSRYARTYCVKNKSDSGDCLEDFLMHIKNLSDSNERVCYIRADNGTEFTGGKFAEVMKREKISSDFAPPYTPELNGMAERFNKTIQKKITALMLDSGLPPTMWVLAAEAATYIYNRTPHKGLLFETPLSRINEKKKSHIGELKRFGCLSYVRIPIADKKFSKKAITTYMVGHTPTGYLLWHPATNRFITSRHVQFNEKVVYKDRVKGVDTDNQADNIIEQLSFEPKEITFEVGEVENIEEQNVEENIEQQNIEDIEPETEKQVETVKPKKRKILA